MIFNHRFTLSALLALSLTALVGCTSTKVLDEPEPVVEDRGVTLRLAIDMDRQSGSRADAPDYFEDPEGSFEEIQTLRVIIINGNVQDQTSADYVEVNKLVKTNASGAPINDNLEFKVVTGTKRVYLIANEATLPVPANLTSTYTNSTAFLDAYVVKSRFFPGTLRDWIVSLPGGNPSSTQSLFSNVPGATCLPLTEYFDFTVSDPGDDQQYDQTQTVHLFMTRASAKATFSVIIDSDYRGEGVDITSIRLNGLNWQQYVFPRATRYNVSKAPIIINGLPTEDIPVTNRYITYFEPTQRVNGVIGANITLNLANPIAIKANTNQSVGPVYIPESMIPATLAENPNARFNVDIELGNGNWLPAQMLGGDAGNIQLIDGKQVITRNTHLKVEIRLSNAGVTATVQVVPYVSVVLNPSFGFPVEE